MKAAEELQLRILSNYKLDFRIEKKERMYKFCIYFSAILRILAVFLIFPSVFLSYYIFIAVGISVVSSLIMDNSAKKWVYTIRYEWHDGIFSIIKIDIDGKEKTVEEVKCNRIKKLEKVNPNEIPPTANRYYYSKHLTDISEVYEVKYRDCDTGFYITPDKYMFALMDEGRKNGIS